jgi:hypothetical protein
MKGPTRNSDPASRRPQATIENHGVTGRPRHHFQPGTGARQGQKGRSVDARLTGGLRASSAGRPAPTWPGPALLTIRRSGSRGTLMALRDGSVGTAATVLPVVHSGGHHFELR